MDYGEEELKKTAEFPAQTWIDEEGSKLQTTCSPLQANPSGRKNLIRVLRVSPQLKLGVREKKDHSDSYSTKDVSRVKEGEICTPRAPEDLPALKLRPTISLRRLQQDVTSFIAPQKNTSKQSTTKTFSFLEHQPNVQSKERATVGGTSASDLKCGQIAPTLSVDPKQFKRPYKTESQNKKDGLIVASSYPQDQLGHLPIPSSAFKNRLSKQQSSVMAKLFK